MLYSDKDNSIFNKPSRYMNRGVTISLWMRLIRYQTSSYNESMDMQKLVCSHKGSVVTDMHS